MDLTGNDWKVVSKNDKKRVMRKKGRRKSPYSTPSTPNTREGLLENPIVLEQLIAMCVEHLQSTYFYETFQLAMSKKLGSSCHSRFKRLVCYGIGNFSKTSATYYEAPLWQLSLALCLRTLLEQDCDTDDIDLFYFDPCATAFENALLEKSYRCRVLPENERGIQDFDDDKTLFFMPHCPAMLYENVVWANWNNLSGLLFVGNSLTRICDSHVAKHGEGYRFSCLRALIPFVNEEELKTASSDVTEAPGNVYGAFNDTYLSWFSFRSERSMMWPDRPYDEAQSEASGELL